jgi:hypothetical protein
MSLPYGASGTHKQRCKKTSQVACCWLCSTWYAGRRSVSE